MSRARVLLCLLITCSGAQGHHASVGVYDKKEVIEIEGTISTAQWRNPHCKFILEAISSSGGIVKWQIESGSISTLRARGLDRQFLRVGDRVRIAGEPALSGKRAIFARNMLLQNGKEVLLTAESTPRWPEGLRGALLESVFDNSVAEQARRTANGIFRVWSTDLDPFVPMYRGVNFPLTAEAQRMRDGWDPLESPFLACEQKSLPLLMASAYPIEFVRAGHNILLRLEEYDSERLIHMNDTEPQSSNRSRMGHSTGHWEGETFVVETTYMDSFPFFFDGTPRSDQATLVERFKLAEDGNRLIYVAVASDPTMFTESVEFTRSWGWRPEIQIKRYDCQD